MFDYQTLFAVTVRNVPSPRHDAMNALFQRNPEFAVEAARLAGVDLPTDVPVTVGENNFNDRPSTDFYADTVVNLGTSHEPVHGLVVEIQLDKTDEKRRQLPRYAAARWLQLERPVTVLVVCPDRKTATWYAEPITTNLPGYVFQAAVLGPDGIPVITEPREAAAHPEMAALSVMAHGRDRKVSAAFVEGTRQLKPDDATQYYEYAYDMSSPDVQQILEQIMTTSTWRVSSPFAREHFGRGEAEGEAKGEAKAVLRVLSRRGLQISDDARKRITTCRDLKQLETWLDRAIAADTTDDLFRGGE